MKAVKKVLDYVTKFEYALMVIAFVAMVICYFVSVINRNIIKGSMPWTEEIAMYSMIYLALLGTEVGLRDGTQVAVTAVIDKLQGTVKKVVALIKQIVVVAFSFIMLSAGYQLFAKQLQMGQTTPVLKLPMAAIYFSLVLSFAIIFLVQIITLIEDVINLPKKEAEV